MPDEEAEGPGGAKSEKRVFAGCPMASYRSIPLWLSTPEERLQVGKRFVLI